MNRFQTSVLISAIVILIIILVVFGLIMAQNSKNYVYPPSVLPCPNYWQMNSEGKCIIPQNIKIADGIPEKPGANLGTWNKTTLDGKTTIPGLDVSKTYVDFNDNGWALNDKSATCAKRTWANNYKIFWDGITNYNGCST